MFPFLPLYVEELGSVTRLSVEFLAGAVFSAQAFSMMLASPVWGTIADRYGRKLMVERAMFGGAIILFLMAFVRSAEELVLLRTIQGLITGTMAAANALLAAIVPRQRVGYAMGLLQVGMGTGVALGPLIGGLIADAYSYSAAFFVTAALLFCSGVLVYFGVEEKFIPDQNLTAQNDGFLKAWANIFTNPGVSTTFSLRFMSQLGRMMIIPVAPLFIATLLLDDAYLNTFTGLVIGASSAATTISAVYLGRFGDRVGHRQVLIFSSLAASLLYLVTSLVQAGWQILFLQALVGVAMGGIIPAISALLANLTSTGETGATYGLDNSINAAGRSVAPMLGSAVAVWFSLRATFSATAVIFLITALLAITKLPQNAVVEQLEEIV
jgi:DHA1 family multidrug resistance protein-like MFS transporter